MGYKILAMRGLASGPLNKEIKLLASGIIEKPFKPETLLGAVKGQLAAAST
jgi:hypothetical protein